MSKLQIIKVARFSFIPLWDCFELRAGLTGRCLCRQNINKYSKGSQVGTETDLT